MTERDEYIKFSEDILSRQDEISQNTTIGPVFVVEDNFYNAWASSLTEEEQNALDEIVPSEFVLPQQFDARAAAEALEKMTKAAELRFEDFLKGKSVSEDEISEKLSEIPDFGANAFVKCADLRVRLPLNAKESPVKSFEKIGNEFALTLNTQKLHDQDRDELMNWRDLEERVRDGFLVRNLLDFDDFSNEKIKAFWQEHVKAPISEHLERAAQPEFSLKLHNNEFSLSEAVSNRIFEPAREFFSKHKNELMSEKTENKLNEINQNSYEELISRYAEQDEFRQNPKLLSSLKTHLHLLFEQAQANGKEIPKDIFDIGLKAAPAAEPAMNENDVPIGYFSLHFDLNADYLKEFSPKTQEAIKNAFGQASIEDGARLGSSTHNAIDKINASITQTATKNGEKQAVDIEKLIKDYQITAHLGNMKLVVAQKEQNGLRPEGHNPFYLGNETLSINQARFDKEKGGFVFQVKKICYLPKECQKIRNLFSSEDLPRLAGKFWRTEPAFSQFDAEPLKRILTHEADNLDRRLRTDFTNPIELILPPKAETFTECVEHTYLQNCAKKMKELCRDETEFILSHQQKFTEEIQRWGTEEIRVVNNKPLSTEGLDAEDLEVVQQLIPEQFVLPRDYNSINLKKSAETFELMTQNAEFQLYDHFEKKYSPEFAKKQLDIVPLFLLNAEIRCADLRIRIDPYDQEYSPVVEFTRHGDNKFSVNIDCSNLVGSEVEHLAMDREISDLVKDRFISEKLLREEDFSNPNVEKFFEQEVKEVAKELSEKADQGDCIQLDFHRGETTLREIAVNRIFEPAKEHFNERKQEFLAEGKDAAGGLNKANQQAFDVLVKSYAEKSEFQNNPKLLSSLKTNLYQLFEQAQANGQVVSLNRFAIDAPSRNTTVVQMKQPAREKEK